MLCRRKHGEPWLLKLLLGNDGGRFEAGRILSVTGGYAGRVHIIGMADECHAAPDGHYRVGYRPYYSASG